MSASHARPLWRLPPSRRLLIAGVLAVLLLVGAIVLVLELDYYAIDFRMNLWEPASLLVQGRSPYGVQDLPPDQSHIAVWFPQVIGLFFPLGWLPLRPAANLWLLGSLATLLGLIIWCRREESTASPLWAAVLTALFPPVLFHLIYGQFDLMAVFLLLLCAHLVDRQRYLPAGLLMALALSKPQLAVLALPGLAVACVRQGRARGIVLFAAGTVLGSALLTAPLWIGYPRWVGDFWRQVQDAPQWFQPSLYTIARLWWGEWSLFIPALISLALLALNLWLWWRYPPEEVLPWSLALTTIASPYIWTWNFVLFLPLIFRSTYRERSRPARIVWIAGYLLCWGLVILLRLALGESFQWHFWMPWLLLGLALAAHRAEDHHRPLLRRAEDPSCATKTTR